MDSVSNFDDLPMRPVLGEDDDSVMDLTPHVSSPARRATLGESSSGLWSTPSSGISGLTGGAEEWVYRVFVCFYVLKSKIIVAESFGGQAMTDSADA
jgi:hypothetical protein